MESETMTQDIKTERRWLRSVIAASAEPLPSFPWMRGHRRTPQAVKPAVTEPEAKRMSLFGKPAGIAAR